MTCTCASASRRACSARRCATTAGTSATPSSSDTLGRYVSGCRSAPRSKSGWARRARRSGCQGDRAAPRSSATKTGVDLTCRMTDYARGRVRALAGRGLSGYVLKSDSPSCGMERVKVYDRGRDAPGATGRGLFARRSRGRAPAPAGRGGGPAADPRLRENFIERVFAYRRLAALREAGGRAGDLVAFHTAHKPRRSRIRRRYKNLVSRWRTRRMVWGARVQAADERRSCAPWQLWRCGDTSHALRSMLGTPHVLDDDSRGRAWAQSIAETTRRRSAARRAGHAVRYHVRRCGISYLAGQANRRRTRRS